MLCIYCGERKATTRDHVPPKCFFSTPRPNNLITVPCCEVCNTKYGKDDERVRNIVTSLATTEGHPAIKEQIAGKRDKSYTRVEGISNFQHIVESLKIVARYTPGGIYLGQAPAFNLDQPTIDRFVERIARALLYQEIAMEHTACDFEWKMSPDDAALDRMPPDIKAVLYGKPKVIGEGVFSYVGYFLSGTASSLWFLNFYGGIDFMVRVSDKSHRSGRAERNLTQ